MIVKNPILPGRVRCVPKSFSWIDHRLVSDRYIERCSHTSGTLYLFLACVGDDKGLSYYGDKTIMKKLSMEQCAFDQARSELIRMGLVAWQKPLYQVLSLEPMPVLKQRRTGSTLSLGDILKGAMEGCHD